MLTIVTSALKLQYTVGQEFSASTLTVTSVGESTFQSWYYGQPNTGNLLGTIKSLDELGVVSLNCTQNEFIFVHGEALHCEWGLISQEGWSVIDDHLNYLLDENYWWVGPNTDNVDTYLFELLRLWPYYLCDDLNWQICAWIQLPTGSCGLCSGCGPHCNGAPICIWDLVDAMVQLRQLGCSQSR